MTENGKKKRNTALFVLVATLVNILLMILFMVIGFILLGRYGNPEAETANQIWLVVIFIGSIGFSWIIYSRMVKAYAKRVDVDSKFAPLISPRKKGRGNDSSMKG